MKLIKLNYRFFIGTFHHFNVGWLVVCGKYI